MIVKIQREQLLSGKGKGQVLVYNKGNTRWWQGVPDAKVDKWIGGRQKVFAHAHVNRAGEFVIDREAKWQDW